MRGHNRFKIEIRSLSLCKDALDYFGDIGKAKEQGDFENRLALNH